MSRKLVKPKICFVRGSTLSTVISSTCSYTLSKWKAILDSRLLLRRPERVLPKVVYLLVHVLFQYVDPIQLKSHACSAIESYSFIFRKCADHIFYLGRWQDFGRSLCCCTIGTCLTYPLGPWTQLENARGIAYDSRRYFETHRRQYMMLRTDREKSQHLTMLVDSQLLLIKELLCILHSLPATCALELVFCTRSSVLYSARTTLLLVAKITSSREASRLSTSNPPNVKI
jgi:hypothetical protein